MTGSELDKNTGSRAGAPSYNGLPKRFLDLGVLFAAHIILLPLWVLLWVLIPLLIVIDDGHPVFYRQRRVGLHGKVFYLLKFRTMIRNADRMGTHSNSGGDLRLTRIGRLLRATALDELPQIIHILRGQMSFIGPRALAEDEFRQLERDVPGFGRRLVLRPGLTGLAQVYGRRNDAREKITYDLKYSNSMNLWLDLKLLMLSVWITFRGRWDSLERKF